MRYIIRFIAAIPMVTVGITAFVMMCLAFGNWLFVIPSIFNAWAALELASNFERTVRSICSFFRVMADKTVIYD